MDPYWRFIWTLHSLLGHDATARFFGADPADPPAAGCRLCHPGLVSGPAAPCGCPAEPGIIRHVRGTCTDPVANRLGWFGFDRLEFTDPGPRPAPDTGDNQEEGPTP